MTFKKKNWIPFRILLSLLLILLCKTALAENIDPNNDNSQFLYGENIGWLNAEPQGAGGPGLQVESDKLSGYLWGENVGWVNLSCTNTNSCATVNFGVNNDGAGKLSGLAWGENVGWINFAPTGAGVTIDPNTGVFSGSAWGENIGWVSLNSTGPGAFQLKTTWTQAAGGSGTGSGGADGGGGSGGAGGNTGNGGAEAGAGGCGCRIHNVQNQNGNLGDILLSLVFLMVIFLMKRRMKEKSI